jgi:hypothetical protein
MPTPEANTEYHCVAFFTSLDLPKLRLTICPSAADTPVSPPSSPLQFAFMPRYSGSLYNNCVVHSIV